MSRKQVSFAILGLTLIAAVALLERGKPSRAQSDQTGAAGEAQTDPPVPREMDFAYYSLREGFGSTLFLVSDSPSPFEFSITVHGSSGQTVVAPSRSIQPQEKLAVDLRSLLTNLGADVEGAFAEGSVAVNYVSVSRPLLGQVTVTNPVLSLVHESEMVENDPGQSDVPPVLNSLWWGLAAGREAKIMVSNMSSEAAVADVFLDFGGEQHKSAPLAFMAYETKMLSIRQLLGDLKFSLAQAQEGGITIVPHGTTPSLIANGRITDPSTGFSTSLNFPLPKRQRASALLASGVPIGTPSEGSPFANAGSFTPHVVVRNLLSSPQSVTLTLEYPTEQGTGQAVLGPLALAAYTTEDISLDALMGQLPLPLPYCSIRIEYSGPPGTALAEVSSIEEEGNLVVDSRLANQGDPHAGSGANPWHLDNETESVLFLTNAGDKPSRIGFQIQAGGVHYYLTDLKLNPHETRAINLRELRDAQKPDFKGNKIPAGATDGDLVWSKMDSVPVVGRVVVFNRGKGLASNYDCAACTLKCPQGFKALTASPSTTDGIPGSTVQFTATETWGDCNGVDFFSNVTTSCNWSSSNTAVATVSDTTSKGLAAAVAVGSATITSTFTDSVPQWFVADQICNDNWVTRSSGGTCDVNALTPSQHTYPNPPLLGGCRVSTPFDAVINTTTKAKHRAQDVVTAGIAVGTPVYASEAGTITMTQTGQPHVNQPGKQCAGQGFPANYIIIQSDPPSTIVTRYVHVTVLPGLAGHVDAGQQIGTVDMSGCTDAPHTHMTSKQSGTIINFTIPCDNSHFDLANTWYDDSDGLD